MGTMGPESIVIGLVGIPGVDTVSGRVYAAEESTNSVNGNPGGGLPRHGAQVRVGGCWIDRRGGKYVENVVGVVTDLRGIHEAGTERVALFIRDGLRSSVQVDEDIIQFLGLNVVRIVMHIRHEQGVD